MTPATPIPIVRAPVATVRCPTCDRSYAWPMPTCPIEHDGDRQTVPAGAALVPVTSTSKFTLNCPSCGYLYLRSSIRCPRCKSDNPHNPPGGSSPRIPPPLNPGAA